MTNHRTLLALALATATTAALAAAPTTALAEDDEGVAVVNAASPVAGQASAGQLAKLRKRLDAMGVLHNTSPELAAALDGGDTADLTPVKDAFEKFDYDRAEELLEQSITDLLTTGDPERIAPPLAEMLHWRGMIADELDDATEAEIWFAASYRLDPERPVDNDATPPRVRRVIERARTAERPDGKIIIDLVDEDEEQVRVAVDGGPMARLGGGVDVPAGYHLVVVTAPERSPYAKLVRVGPNRTVNLSVELSAESEVARARRARDSVAAARSDKARLKKARPLAKITGARKLLVIEGEDELVVRVFDLDARTVTAPLSLREATRPAVLADLLGVEGGALGRDRDRRWYERWYVWVGVAALAGGGYVTYEMATREPTSIRF
jgi:hypothetical protein